MAISERVSRNDVALHELPAEDIRFAGYPVSAEIIAILVIDMDIIFDMPLSIFPWAVSSLR